MSILKINYDQLQKLESLPEAIKKDVMWKALCTSILNTKETVSEYAIKCMERDGVIKIDHKVMLKRIALGKIKQGTDVKDVYSYLRFSTINESLSSFPWKKTYTKGTDGKVYPSFITQVLGRQIDPMPKTFISNKKHISLKRISKDQKELRKAFTEKSSISDMLRFKTNILDKIIARTNKKYESEINRNVRWQIMKI
ncbi:MAG: hypothetical protein K2X69_09200 [Silvanigrellaceae bacterium]|nr:hypothetical protein [Silvanigrellaceae bacterium]